MRRGKLFLIAVIALVVAFMAISPLPVRADQDDKDEGAAIALDVSCPGSEHDRVIDVRFRVVNDADSGIGRYWANDAYTKYIEVTQTGPSTFCVVVNYDGRFVATDGSSPMGTGHVSAGVTGTMTGGYRATITGTLNPNPAYKRKGNLGKFDYGWAGDPNNPAPNPFGWVSTYFLPGNTFEYIWWGWVYNTPRNGIWFNTAGNAGDIKD